MSLLSFFVFVSIFLIMLRVFPSYPYAACKIKFGIEKGVFPAEHLQAAVLFAENCAKTELYFYI